TVTAVSNFSICCRIILLISSALITSTIVVVLRYRSLSAGLIGGPYRGALSAGQLFLHPLKLAFDGPVVDHAAESRDDAADDLGVDTKLESHLLTGHAGETVLQLLPLYIAYRPCRGDICGKYSRTGIEFSLETLEHAIELVKALIGKQQSQEVDARLAQWL